MPGDVIVEFNGKPVKDSDSLVAMVVATKPGTTVPVTIVRDNQRKTLNVTSTSSTSKPEQTRSPRRGGTNEPARSRRRPASA